MFIGLNFGQTVPAVSFVGTDVQVREGESRSVSMSVSEDLSGKTLRVVWQRLRRRGDVAVVEDGAITRSASTVQFVVPSEVTDQPQTLDYAVLDISGGGNRVVKAGKWQVLAAAQKDA